MAQHSGLPWKLPLRVSNRSLTEIRDANGDVILNVFTIDKLSTLPALVLAANCHDPMVAALKEVDRWLLVIESAVKTDAPRDYAGVKAAMEGARTALSLSGEA